MSSNSTMSGFSLLEIIIAMGLIAIVGAFASRAFLNSKSTGARISENQEYRQIDHLIKTALVDAIANSNCQKPHTLAASIPITDDIELQYFDTTVDLSHSARLENHQALRRCQKPLNPGADGLYRFCTRVVVTSKKGVRSFSDASFVKSTNAFMEIMMEPYNFAESKRENCKKLKDKNPNVGVRIAYSLFWDIKENNEFRTRRKNGVYLSLVPQ